jgi:endonuclease YncB( thermonuclease family)
MPFLPVLIVSGVAVVHTPAVVKRSESVLVRAVIDAATIDVATIGHVRLLAIVAITSRRGVELEPVLGRQARERLQSLVLNHWVRLEYEQAGDISGRDARLTNRKFRPRAAYVVREDGVFVNAVLVREGLARLNLQRGTAPFTRLEELQRAARDAQLYGRGLWAPGSGVPGERRSKARRRVAPTRGDRYTSAAKKPPTALRRRSNDRSSPRAQS